MVALGENPLDFERHRARLQGTWGFGLDPLIDVETDELAWLLWRKQRVEGTRDCLLVDLKEQADTESRRREREHIRDTVDQEEARRIGLRRMEDSPAAFQQTLVMLQVLKEDAERGDFASDHAGHMLYLYGEESEPSGHGPMIKDIFRKLSHPEEETKGRSPEKERELLLRGIALETQQVEAEYALYRRDHIELTVWARGALMGADKESSWIIREGVSLDRAIDRKIKLLMGLRKDLRQQLKWEREQVEADARGQESGVGCHEPEVRSQESEVTSQEAEEDSGLESNASPVTGPTESFAPTSTTARACDEPETASVGTDGTGRAGKDL